MPLAKSTRLRFISGKKRQEITAFISGLPFKIEIKQVLQDKNKTIVWYVLPDNAEFNNIELD